MGAEKLAAFGEAWQAMTLQMLKSNQQLAASMMRSWWPGAAVRSGKTAAPWCRRRPNGSRPRSTSSARASARCTGARSPTPSAWAAAPHADFGAPRRFDGVDVSIARCRLPACKPAHVHLPLRPASSRWRSACAGAWRRLAWVGLAVALAGCASLPDKVERPATKAQRPAVDTPLGRIAKASTADPEQSGFRLMPTGQFALQARIELARRAQRTLDVQYYQIHDDRTGRYLLRTLRDAVRARRARAPDHRRPVHLGAGPAAPRPGRLPERRGAAVQPVPGRAGRTS